MLIVWILDVLDQVDRHRHRSYRLVLDHCAGNTYREGEGEGGEGEGGCRIHKGKYKYRVLLLFLQDYVLL